MEAEKALQTARKALLTLPDETSLHGGSPDPRFLHLPASHLKALRPDAMLVAGMRGAGKTFWWAALQDQANRKLLETLPSPAMSPNIEVKAGFGERPNPDAYPSRDVLAKLTGEDIEPRLIWRTVVIFHLAEDSHDIRKRKTWQERADYVVNDPEGVDGILARSDADLVRRDSWSLILFDALDRSAVDWKQMYALIRGLLQTALDLRPYRRLRLKCFLRTDQLDESAVADFPDASKVLSSKVELSWPAQELYGLLWQYLGNAPGQAGLDFRAETERVLGMTWAPLSIPGDKPIEGHIWQPPSSLSIDHDQQRSLFHAITGPWMGRDRRRGFPYTWVPGHLADAQGRTSPRSFLAALRAAAKDTKERYRYHDWALYFESIKRGVQAASQIRVQELQEDYPWVQAIMKPLRGMVVPCEFDRIESEWRKRNILAGLSKKVEKEEVRLPPEHLEQGAEGVRCDLEDLGIFLRLRDGRVNVPDVFRVGYGLGRRGGVRPVHRGDMH